MSESLKLLEKKAERIKELLKGESLFKSRKELKYELALIEKLISEKIQLYK